MSSRSPAFKVVIFDLKFESKSFLRAFAAISDLVRGTLSLIKQHRVITEIRENGDYLLPSDFSDRIS